MHSGWEDDRGTRCFTGFDDRRHKHKLSGQEALNQHKLICGAHKPILPVMSKEGECLQLMYNYHYNVMQRHYGDDIELMYTDSGKYIKTILFYIIYHSFF